MPVSNRRDEKYSSATGVIYLFNLIVGTGALALPGALQKAGWVFGVILLLVLGLFSWIGVTFIVESLAVANALLKKRYGGAEYQSTIEQTPLVTHDDDPDSNVFEITEKFELGQMGVLMSPRWSQVIIYLSLCTYLYGDLAIYPVVIGNTLSHVLCNYVPRNMTESEIPQNTRCWKDHNLSRIEVYRISVAAFVALMGPFVFFNLQKTKFLQILTGVMRWVAFFIMLVWSIQNLSTYGSKGHPEIADFKALPALFGTLVYSFMCQHSVPGLLQPIRNKNHLKAIVKIDLILVSIFYLALSLTAIFTFENVKDLYTLNFWDLGSAPNALTIVKVLSYYLALFPVFTLSTSFPIIGITLRNNLRSMILKDHPQVWYFDKLFFPLLTILPPAALALWVSDIRLLVAIVGSYAGTCVQYLIPCLLIVFARSLAQEFNTINMYASPFKSYYWVYAVYAWVIVSLVFITINIVKFEL